MRRLVGASLDKSIWNSGENDLRLSVMHMEPVQGLLILSSGIFALKAEPSRLHKCHPVKLSSIYRLRVKELDWAVNVSSLLSSSLLIFPLRLSLSTLKTYRVKQATCIFGSAYTHKLMRKLTMEET